MNIKQQDFNEHLQQIERDIADIVQCLQMLWYFYSPTKIDSEIAKPVIKVRDSLIHNAILSMSRVLDKWKKGQDRVCFDRIVYELNQQNTFAKSNEFDQTKKTLLESDDWKYCLSIRHGRIAHSLDDRGAPVICWHKLNNVRNQIIELMEILQPGFKRKIKELTGEWNTLSELFWNRLAHN